MHSTPFQGSPLPGVVGENPAHEPGGKRVEVCAVVELYALEREELQKSLVNEAGGLKRVAGSLSRQLSVRDPVKLFVYQWRELVESPCVTGAMRVQEVGDVLPA